MIDDSSIHHKILSYVGGGVYLHESEQETTSGITNRLLSIAETLNGGRDESIEVNFEVVAGEYGGGGEGLEAALRDAEVGVILEEIQAGIHK